MLHLRTLISTLPLCMCACVIVYVCVCDYVSVCIYGDTNIIFWVYDYNPHDVCMCIYIYINTHTYSQQ